MSRKRLRSVWEVSSGHLHIAHPLVLALRLEHALVRHVGQRGDEGGEERERLGRCIEGASKVHGEEGGAERERRPPQLLKLTYILTYI